MLSLVCWMISLALCPYTRTQVLTAVKTVYSVTKVLLQHHLQSLQTLLVEHFELFPVSGMRALNWALQWADPAAPTVKEAIRSTSGGQEEDILPQLQFWVHLTHGVEKDSPIFPKCPLFSCHHVRAALQNGKRLFSLRLSPVDIGYELNGKIKEYVFNCIVLQDD